ncbi:hypothetical protein [Alteromonas sp. S015]|uniref:hypothetical protein n=1 Tax=Alteromonas sp. S015 TaxID=3117401 RepID=UPI002FE0AFCE
MLPVASTDDDWKIAEQIVNQIQLPTIPNEKFVVDVSNTSQSAARAPIQSVINKASASGGGTVIKSGRDADGRIRGIRMASFKHLFWFQLNYPSNLHGNFPATYTDIIIENLTVENVGAARFLRNTLNLLALAKRQVKHSLCDLPCTAHFRPNKRLINCGRTYLGSLAFSFDQLNNKA